MIDDRTAYGQGVADEFAKGREGWAADVAEQQFTNDKATDFTAILTAIKAKKPDVVFYGGMDAVAGPMIRQMKQLGINAKFLGGDGICSGELPKLAAGAMADGQVICAEAGGVEGEQKAGMEKFKADFKKKFNADVQIYALRRSRRDDGDGGGDGQGRLGRPGQVPAGAGQDHELQRRVTGNISFDEKGDIKNGALTLYTQGRQARADGRGAEAAGPVPTEWNNGALRRPVFVARLPSRIGVPSRR